MTLDTIRRFDLVLRPRLPALVGLLVAAIGFPLFLLKLSYDTASFDPRLVLIAVYSAVAIVFAVRARIVVAEGLLWRRGIVGYRAVSLDALDTVEFRRPRLSKNEGLVPTRLLRITDVYGRTVTLKPVYWANSASLLAIVSAASRAQQLDVDPKAAALLMSASQRVGHRVPSWAYRREPLRAGLPVDDANGVSVVAATFWTRRDASGKPKKAQPQRLIPILLAMALMLPVLIVTGSVGKHVIRSVRCNSARALWTAAPDTPSTGLNLDTAAARLSSTQLVGASARIFNLGVADIADRDNTAAVQRDAQSLEAGFDIQWTAGRDVVADIQLEQFPSHAAALTFQRDYAEDHCHAGDRAFAPPGIPGAVGFRCDCTASTVTDRIGFVRGPLRVQAIAWNVSTKADHRVALGLASAANQVEQASR